MKTNQVDLQDELHAKMKNLAWEQKLTIKSFISRAIEEKIEREQKKDE